MNKEGSDQSNRATGASFQNFPGDGEKEIKMSQVPAGVNEVSADIMELAAKLGIDPSKLQKAAERAVNSAASKGERYQKTYQKMKEKAASDPDYASKVRAQRAKYAKSRQEIIKKALAAFKASQTATPVE